MSNGGYDVVLRLAGAHSTVGRATGSYLVGCGYWIFLVLDARGRYKQYTPTCSETNRISPVVQSLIYQNSFRKDAYSTMCPFDFHFTKTFLNPYLSPVPYGFARE